MALISESFASRYSAYKLPDIPDSMYYIPNYLTHDEATFLRDSVYKVPLSRWTVLSNRRLQNWGGLPHPKGI